MLEPESTSGTLTVPQTPALLYDCLVIYSFIILLKHPKSVILKVKFEINGKRLNAVYQISPLKWIKQQINTER